ncbi:MULTISPECIES: DUF6087 family protein [Streptacidiphilus]|uniref:DUF6087 family protein n=1 Tax=Streptacidiphilus cavernicola TaxID=3342716 RepID=A0ABV6V0X7_9ACTN|nr:DUF6087 family protein [Streptacidiphilus jeojiense]
MGKHSRPDPRNESELPDDVDPADEALLYPYIRRRRPPLAGRRIHHPINGGASHVRPDEARLLLEWDGFAYQPGGVAVSLAEAHKWASKGV